MKAGPCGPTNRLATVAQFTEKCNSGRKESEYTVYHSLLCIVLHSRRPIGVPMVTPAITKSANNKRVSKWTTEKWKKEACFIFLNLHNVDVCASHA